MQRKLNIVISWSCPKRNLGFFMCDFFSHGGLCLELMFWNFLSRLFWRTIPFLRFQQLFLAVDEWLLCDFSLGNVCLFPDVVFPAMHVLAAFYETALFISVLQLLHIEKPIFKISDAYIASACSLWSFYKYNK